MVSASMHLYAMLCRWICMYLDLLPAGMSSGVAQSFIGIPVWGGKDLHLWGAAQFPTANSQTWEWWELDPLLIFILSSSLQLFNPQAFVSLRKIVATLCPADQWEHIWLWFCCQCHRCRAKHRAISPWQQGKWRRNNLSGAPKSFNWANTASQHLLMSVHIV